MPTMYVSWIGGVESQVASTPISSNTLTTSAVSVKTSTAPANATMAVVFGDAPHYVAVGPQASVTAASTSGIFVPANFERHIAINPGDAVAARTV